MLSRRSLLRRKTLLALVVSLTLVAATVFTASLFFRTPSSHAAGGGGGGGGCPSINAINNFLPSNDGLAAAFTLSDTNSDTILDTATYSFTSNDESPTDGVPGLIEYCVYPSQPPGNPNSATASYDSWNAVFGAIQGFFAFKRPDGNPSNVPFDGTTQPMGTATWNAPSAAPGTQTILLHINDADECQALYGGTSDTCFVFPGGENHQGACPNNEVACKQVVIDEAITTSPLTVPAFTQLHLHYLYIFNNSLGTNMYFRVPTPKTQDINSGGGKDYFGCEQIPDPAGSPGTWGTYPGWITSPGSFKLDFKQGGGTCNQSRFFLTANVTTVTLPPGGTITFAI